MPRFEANPLVYALGADGALRYIDAVANGSACGCSCPSCGQPLVAKNNGVRITHHFAHMRASCGWAVERAVVLIAESVLLRERTMLVEGAGYLDAERWRWICFPPAGKLDVCGIEENFAEGESPALIIRCVDERGTQCEFALTAPLTRRPSEARLARLAAGGRPVLALDFKASYAALRDEEGRHFSRGDYLIKVQDPEAIRAILLGGDGSEMLTWASHSRRDEAEAEAAEREQRRLQDELERKLTEMERANALKRAAVERERSEERRLGEELRRRAIEAEERAFSEAGVETLPKVSDGVNYYVDGCPLYGRADVVTDCGCYDWSPGKCIFFEGQLYYTVGCTARQNGMEATGKQMTSES